MKIRREIIKIDKEKCNGCGECIPNCPEGALQIIDGKARLISDLFCDGLGACIGHCPQEAITVEERESEPYDEKKVMENVVKQGKNVIKAHLQHLKEHGQKEYLREAVDFLKEKNLEIPPEIEIPEGDRPHAHAASACPGSKMMYFAEKEKNKEKTGKTSPGTGTSYLHQWPVQLMLVPVGALYFKDADLLIAADCVPFAYADFHADLLKDKILLVACPKLDDTDYYREKLRNIFAANTITSITVAHMEVPCCFGLVNLVKEALGTSGKDIPLREVTIGIRGDKK